MSFTSPLYYFFLAVSLIIYFNVPARYRGYLLLFSSYIFYISFNPRFIIFILVTTFVSYFCARKMALTANENHRKAALAFALLVELSLLGLTKYWNPVAFSTGLMSPLEILVPLGISFYTFQSMGYLMDVYRKEITPELSFPKYALFLSFFPHLIAGPIEPAQHFLPQLSQEKTYCSKAVAFGIILVLYGLFKKLVIADNLNTVVDLVFENPRDHFGSSVAFATLLARYQIYCDFSGYTDIALGSAMMFGFKLTRNFDRPFFSTSISEYWKRWHMSLSNWIKNYIFYPLITTPIARMGFSALMIITFLVLGLWHGLTFNFVFYGLIQGVLIVLDAKTRDFRQNFYRWSGLINHSKLLNSTCILVTFFFIVVPPTLLFRSPNFTTSMIMIHNLIEKPWSFSDLIFISKSYYLIESLKIAVLGIVIMEFLDWIHKTKINVAELLWNKSHKLIYLSAFIIFLIIIIFGKLNSESNFIYAQF